MPRACRAAPSKWRLHLLSPSNGGGGGGGEGGGGGASTGARHSASSPAHKAALPRILAALNQGRRPLLPAGYLHELLGWGW
jgi:hypothetical protein